MGTYSWTPSLKLGLEPLLEMARSGPVWVYFDRNPMTKLQITNKYLDTNSADLIYVSHHMNEATKCNYCDCV